MLFLPIYLLILLFIFVYMLVYDLMQHMFVSECTNKILKILISLISLFTCSVDITQNIIDFIQCVIRVIFYYLCILTCLIRVPSYTWVTNWSVIITRDWNNLRKSKRRRNQHPIFLILSGDNTNNLKRFWSFTKGKRIESTGVAPLRREDILHSDTAIKVNILNGQFTAVFSSEKEGDIPTKGNIPYPSVPDIIVHQAGVYKLLHNINQHETTDPDTIPGKLL